MSVVRRPGVRNAMLAGASVAVALGMLGGVEGVVRLLSPAACAQLHGRAENLAWIRGLARPALEIRGWPTGRTVWHRRDRDAQKLGPLARTAGRTRTVVIGESTGDLLAMSMAFIAPPTDEVFDGAMPGSGVAQLETNFARALEADPDAVVIVFGHNLDFHVPRDSPGLWLAETLAPSCALATLVPGDPSAVVERDSFERDWTEFERFVHSAAARARARGIALLGTTMASNRAMPPSGTEVTDRTPLALEASWVAVTGQPLEAVAAWRAVVAERPVDAGAHFGLGRALVAAGLLDEARAEWVRARDLDEPSRARTAFNDRWRALAARERIVLRDTVHVVEDAVADPSQDWGSFRDNCHPRDSVLTVESQAVLELVHAARHLPPIAWPAVLPRFRPLPPSLVRVVAMVSPSTGRVESRWLGAITAMLAWAVRHDAELFATLLPPDASERAFASLPPTARAQVEVAVAEALYRTTEDATARRYNADARARGSADAWVQHGLECVRSQHRDDARDAFTRALAIEPGRADASFYLARIAPVPSTHGSGGPS